MRVLVLLALASCYDPHPIAGAPCSESEPCPSGLACVAHQCGGMLPDDNPDGNAGGPIDGPVDGVVTATDLDGDGVMDVDDNCPSVVNPGQGNEDGDRFGDACDPCPIEANDNPSDPDGDGVADGCDPHPNAAGDAIAVFEGFHAGVPGGWQVIGNIVGDGDAVSLTTPADNIAVLVPPIATIANGTITAGLTVDTPTGNFDSATTVTMPYDPGQDQGVFCELYAPLINSPNGRHISLWDSKNQIERGMRQFGWQTATPYRVALTRAGSGYTCTISGAGVQPQVATGQTGATPGTKAAIGIYGASVHAAYLMVVTSP